MRASGVKRRSSPMLDNAPPPATRDELPSDCVVNRRLDQDFANTAAAYGFEEVSTPLFERAELFAARSGVGDPERPADIPLRSRGSTR